MPSDGERSFGEAWEFTEEPDFTRAPRYEEPEGERPELDAVCLYFQQIARVPLLKPQQERALSEQIEAAQHALAAALFAVPSAVRRIKELSTAVQSGVLVSNGLLESPGGRPLSAREIAVAVSRLTDARRQVPALMRAHRALAAKRLSARRRLELERSIDRLDASLSERERRVIELRYGIVNTHEHTLQEIADQLGVSRERVRQIEKQAMNRLRRGHRPIGTSEAA